MTDVPRSTRSTCSSPTRGAPLPVTAARPRARALARCALAASLLAACGDDDVVAPPPAPIAASGVVVMDGFIQPGLTLVSDTGGSSSRITLGDPTTFDAGAFDLMRDTVVAASSRGAGDLLYLAALATGAVRTVQLPVASNPSTPRLLANGGGAARIAVALRDSQQVALVRVAATGAPTIERIGNVGVCPVDAREIAGALWVLDANASCRTNYRAIGDLRLIRVSGTARDTIVLTGLRGSGASLLPESGDRILVAAGGDADFSSFPFTLTASGAVARVDLATRRVVATRAMPAGSFGATLRRDGAGGYLVTMSEDLVNFASRSVQLDGSTLEFTGTRVPGRDFLDLRTAGGEPLRCSGLVGDGIGRRFCFQNRTGSATFVLVLGPDGAVTREFPAGQGGVAMALR